MLLTHTQLIHDLREVRKEFLADQDYGTKRQDEPVPLKGTGHVLATHNGQFTTGYYSPMCTCRH